MVMSTSQQVALAFTVVLFTFVVLPRMFGVGVGSGTKETRFDSRYSKKGPGPGGVRSQPIKMNAPGSPQTPENLQQMKKLMEQEMKSDKFKSNSNKGYVFTLMPLYAIGVGVFAAYKFLKIKSADDQAQKDKFAKGAKKSAEAENQLNELEQRLAQTERMLNSILTQLDPLTNCVKTVAQEQKNEIMSQLQTIRYLMKKRGMDCPPLNEASCERNLDDLIESLGASDSAAASEAPQVDSQASEGNMSTGENTSQEQPEATDEDMKELVLEHTQVEGVEEVEEEEEEEEDEEVEDEEVEDEEVEDEGLEDMMPTLEDTNIEEVVAQEPAAGLRRRIRPE